MFMREYESAGKGRTPSRCLPYLTDSGELPPYRAVAQQLQVSEGAVKVAVHRLRQRFGAVLRQQVSDTVLSAEDTEDEMRELMRVVAS